MGEQQYSYDEEVSAELARMPNGPRVKGVYTNHFGEPVAMVHPIADVERRREAGSCCEHSLAPVEPSRENLEFVKRQLMEEDLGDGQCYCRKCGALFLFDHSEEEKRKIYALLGWDCAGAGLWAYDATARFFGRVPQRAERRNDRPRGKGNDRSSKRPNFSGKKGERR